MAWTWVRGELVIAGYQPDGDSVRIVPTSQATVRGLENGGRIEPSARDGSVQLRLDAIDAPESHYQGRAQPLAEPARDTLLARAGFGEVEVDDDGSVASSTPDRVPAAIAASLVEVYGRPVALLYTGADVEAHDDGDTVEPTAAFVDSSVNAEQVRNGRAYVTLYSSTPEPVRVRFVELARDADGPGSVWAADRSGGFPLTRQSDVGPDGALILPKLFRRATNYLAAGTDATFVDWLTAQGEDDDPVLLDGRRTVLSELVRQDGDEVSLIASPLDLVFVE